MDFLGKVIKEGLDIFELEKKAFSEERQHGGGDPRANEVAYRSHGEATKDGAGEGSYADIANISVGEVEVLADDEDKKRDGEEA